MRLLYVEKQRARDRVFGAGDCFEAGLDALNRHTLKFVAVLVKEAEAEDLMDTIIGFTPPAFKVPRLDAYICFAICPDD